MKERTEPVAIWGAGGHSRVVAELLRICGVGVACFVESPVGTHAFRSSATFDVIRDEEPVAALGTLRSKGISRVMLGFGQCRGRLEVGQLIVNGGFELMTCIHPSAVVADNAKLGNGVFIGAGSVIDPGVSIGDYSIVNHGAILCHDTKIGRACHICPGVAVAGGCVVGDSTWLGVGSCCRDRVQIGERVFAGSGSNVVHDIPPGSLVYGNPARHVRSSPDCF